MSTLMLALRLLRRDWRARELSVLAAALLLAVASIGTVGIFADRVKASLTVEADKLMGADLLVSGDRPLPPRYAEEAHARGLVTTPAIRFNSMVEAAGRETGPAVLADVKAITQGYPLRSAVTLVVPGTREPRTAEGVPAAGTAWIDRDLAQRLNVGVGQSLHLGDAVLTIAAIIERDPEVAGLTLVGGPKVLFNLADLARTRLMQPGTRATYRLMLAAPDAATLDAYRTWVGDQLTAGQRVEGVRDLRPELRQTLERAERYLGLAALVAVLLAAVAVALAAARYLRRHLDAAALMRCFGASALRTLTLFVVQFLVLGALACIAGAVLAWAGQWLLAYLLARVLATPLPAATAWPMLHAIAAGMALLLGFGLPPLVALSRAAPLRVLRRDLPRPRAGGLLAYLAGAGVIAALVAWQAGVADAAAIMVAGVAGLIVLATLAAWLLLALLRRLPRRAGTWRFGLANLGRRPLASSLQIAALSLGLMALLLLTLVRGELLRGWQASVPPDAPNQFLVNVLPDQVAPARTLLQQTAGVEPSFKPMVRGRLVARNGTPFDARSFADVRARRLAEREFNLSWTEALPSGNRVVSGAFWAASARGLDAGLSLEEGLAHTLGIALGDTLTFDIAGGQVSARVTSLRKVDWDSFRVNFFALFAPGALDGQPATYIAAFRVPDDRPGWLSALVQRFPNILAIDVGQILAEVERMIGQVSRAVEFVFLFTLAGGLLVLQAAIAATQDERRHDAAVLRSLGASTRQLRSAQLTEFAVQGAVAGIVASVGALVVGWALADRVFNVPYELDPRVVLYGVLGGTLAVTLAGWLGTRATLRQPPLAILRQAA
jgi:putative ABC transport system permease protein